MSIRSCLIGAQGFWGYEICVIHAIFGNFSNFFTVHTCIFDHGVIRVGLGQVTLIFGICVIRRID